MSNSLAIATVTASLAQIIRAAVQLAVTGSDVVVGRPVNPAGNDEQPRVRLYLYQVAPNAALGNADLPTRGPDGTVVKRPCAALELHYLLSFYGNEAELQPERMLAAALRDLHSRPILSGAMIRNVIAGYPVLADSDLDESVEQVRFSPLNLSLEEQSKLWSVFFQTAHAVSVAYRASVVLIDSDESPRASLPVLRRGEEDRGVDSLIGPFPWLGSAYVGLPDDPILQSHPVSFPAARMGLAVIVKGRNLGGEKVLLRFQHSRRDLRTKADEELITDLTVADGDISPTELKIVLPLPGSGTSQDDWAPGIYTITAVEKSSTDGRDRTSNSLPLALSPLIATIEPPNPIQRDGEGTVSISITCRPRVHEGQRAVLLLAGREIVGEIDDGDPDKVKFVVEDAPVVQDELLRLRVDGAESMPFRRIDAPPPARFEFDEGERVTIT